MTQAATLAVLSAHRGAGGCTAPDIRCRTHQSCESNRLMWGPATLLECSQTS